MCACKSLCRERTALATEGIEHYLRILVRHQLGEDAADLKAALETVIASLKDKREKVQAALNSQPGPA
jgi:predicted component of type VI protein secretion system